MKENISNLKKDAQNEILNCDSLEMLEQIRLRYLGRKKGKITNLLKSLKTVPLEKRRELGSKANKLKIDIVNLIQERKTELERAKSNLVLQKEWLDVTRPGTKIPKGGLHPITLVFKEIFNIFNSLGFKIIEGPEVESEYYNFDALNIPPHHPAREMWDTFWLKQNSETKHNPKKHFLLRTHTSPMQVRYMEKNNPPIRIIVPGRVYRYEATDASHNIQFYQLEGLMVDKDISIANFKAIIQEFFSRLFRTNINIRLRPSYFPFTEPSFEVDISCTNCGRKKSLRSSKNKAEYCPVCKGKGWLEIAGAGMVHPNVFKAAGYMPGEYQGFAFGMGIDRIVMMRYKIPDIRLLYSGDLRFLKQS